MTQHDNHEREIADALARLTGTPGPMTNNTALATELTDAANALDAEYEDRMAVAREAGPPWDTSDADIAGTMIDDEPGDLDPEASDITEVADWWEVYKLAKQAAKEARERADEAYAIVTSKLIEEGREYGLVNGQRVLRYRPIESKRFDSKAFREVHEDLYEAFTKTVEAYRLDIL